MSLAVGAYTGPGEKWGRPSPLAALVSVLALALGCAPPRDHGPLSQEAYVWQRRWTPEVRGAVAVAGDLDGLVLLAAEVGATVPVPRVARVAVEPAALAGRGYRVGLTLRVGPSPRPVHPAEPLGHQLRGLASELVAAGATDALGLAGDALGWEARAHWARGDHGRAFELYQEQLERGHPAAAASLYRSAGWASELPDGELEALARHPGARRVIQLALLDDPRLEHWEHVPRAPWPESAAGAGWRPSRG